MTAPARPLRRDAALNRERVLAAAAEVFHEQGLSAGLEDVARRAGVGVGTLYRRFPTREVLLEALLDELLQAYAREASTALTGADGAGLAVFLRRVGDVGASSRGCVAKLLGESGKEVLKVEVRRLLAELLADAQQHRTCRVDVTVEDLLAVLVAVRAVREIGELDWRRHLELCLAGLAPQ